MTYYNREPRPVPGWKVRKMLQKYFNRFYAMTPEEQLDAIKNHPYYSVAYRANEIKPVIEP